MDLGPKRYCTAVTGLSNPFWISVNTLLRALGFAKDALQVLVFRDRNSDCDGQSKATPLHLLQQPFLAVLQKMQYPVHVSDLQIKLPADRLGFQSALFLAAHFANEVDRAAAAPGVTPDLKLFSAYVASDGL